MNAAMYWFEVGRWLDRQLKKSRRAIYRARRFDEAGIWAGEISVADRIRIQIANRKDQLVAVRTELEMARSCRGRRTQATTY